MTQPHSPRSSIVAFGILAVVMLAPGAARAQSFTLGPFTETFTEVNPCTGETVLVTASTRIFGYTKIDSSGRIHMTTRTLIHGNGEVVDPVTMLSGTTPKYRFNNENVSGANLPSSGSMEQTTVINYALIRQGNDPGKIVLDTATHDDFIMKTTVHFTMNSNGIMTADFIRGHSSCPVR